MHYVTPKKARVQNELKLKPKQKKIHHYFFLYLYILRQPFTAALIDKLAMKRYRCCECCNDPETYKAKEYKKLVQQWVDLEQNLLQDAIYKCKIAEEKLQDLTTYGEQFRSTCRYYDARMDGILKTSKLLSTMSPEKIQEKKNLLMANLQAYCNIFNECYDCHTTPSHEMESPPNFNLQSNLEISNSCFDTNYEITKLKGFEYDFSSFSFVAPKPLAAIQHLLNRDQARKFLEQETEELLQYYDRIVSWIYEQEVQLKKFKIKYNTLASEIMQAQENADAKYNALASKIMQAQEDAKPTYHTHFQDAHDEAESVYEIVHATKKLQKLIEDFRKNEEPEQWRYI